MNLSEIHSLSTTEKRQWLRSGEGLTQLRNWVTAGITAYQIARMLQISSSTFNGWRRYAEIGELIGHPQPQLPDLSRPPAYRIIYAYDDHKSHFKGCIMEEFTTPEQLLASIFVQQYFNTFGKSEVEYLNAYLAAMQSTGVFKLSNLYLLTYCTVSKKGLIKPHKSPV